MFLTLFVILVMVSCIANSATLLLIIKQKLYKESITLCLANMMGVHSLQACLVLPLCLYTRLVQNWVLGETLCYVLPVITVIKAIRSKLDQTVVPVINKAEALSHGITI